MGERRPPPTRPRSAASNSRGVIAQSTTGANPSKPKPAAITSSQGKGHLLLPPLLAACALHSQKPVQRLQTSQKAASLQCRQSPPHRHPLAWRQPQHRKCRSLPPEARPRSRVVHPEQRYALFRSVTPTRPCPHVRRPPPAPQAHLLMRDVHRLRIENETPGPQSCDRNEAAQPVAIDFQQQVFAFLSRHSNPPFCFRRSSTH